jgi:3-keto-disaccharide hydrolase
MDLPKIFPSWGQRRRAPARSVHLTTTFAALAVVAAFCAAAVAGQPKEAPGYDDTPFLPGSPWRVHDRRRPQPPLVEPGARPGDPPSDAVILFDGKDLSQWQGGNPRGVQDGTLNILKTGELRSKQQFGDCQVHVEWMTPAKPDGGPMTWGNSGVFLMDLFEVQIIESRASHIYADGNAGAVYGQTPAMVNASRRPGQWQTFDIVFTAPRFKGGKLAQPAYVTVLQNGVLVQNHTVILGATVHRALPAYRSTATQGPIRLQQHGSAVRFRNIWVRRLKPRGA